MKRQPPKKPSHVASTASREIIDDRSVRSRREDALQLDDFARELADLACNVETPANIALFGPWGSGKSSMSNFLAEALRDLNHERQLAGAEPINFTRFDAFKYAEKPLRRHFLSQVARSFKIKASKYHEDLYSTTVTNNLTFPGRTSLGAIVWLALAIALGITCVLVILLAIAFWLPGTTRHAFGSLVEHVLPLAFIPTTLIATLLALAGKTFSSTRTTDAPDGDEQFEARFQDLVRDIGGARLVIFIDELDRCESDKVVATLETLRTFLEVPNCVFIVAADQQVLEQALSRSASQETPVDPANPYYSSGSAYLDKIFQYQFGLPPLKQQRLSKFAYELVRDRNGLWQDLPELEDVISILIPSHVRSPRRVKVLLNSFRLSYRLARRRVEAGMLSSDLPERSTELAKLVCLRVEFPLFAQDLTLFSRLPQLVLSKAEGDPRLFSGTVPPEIDRRATLYAAGELPVAELMTEEFRRLPLHPLPESIREEDGTTEDTLSEGEVVAAAHAQQLIRYLQKTGHIGGPGADLIHLESAGAIFDLEPDLADQLESAAVDNRTRDVISVIGGLSEGQRSQALLLLAQLARHSAVGIEGANSVSALLQAVAAFPGPATHVADDLTAAVEGHQRRYQFRGDDLLGALALGRAGKREGSERLVDAVIERDEALSLEPLGLEILRVANDIGGRHRQRVGEILWHRIYEDSASVVVALDNHSDEVAAALLRAAIPYIREAVAPAFAADADDEAVAELPDPEVVRAELPDLLGGFLQQDRKESAQAAAELMLSVKDDELDNRVYARLEAMDPVTSDELTRLLLECAPKRLTEEWPRWLGILEPARVVTTNGNLVAALASEAWEEATAEEPDSREVTRAALSCLSSFVIAGVQVESDGLAAAVRESGGSGTDAASISARDELYVLANEFVDAALLNATALSTQLLEVMAGFAQDALPVGSVPQELQDHIYRWTDWAAPWGPVDQLQAMREAAFASPWIEEPRREEIVLRAEAALRQQNEQIANPYDLSAMQGVVERHRRRAALAVGLWLVSTRPDPSDAWLLLKPLAPSHPPRALSDALETYSHQLSAKARLAFIMFALRVTLSRGASPEFLVAAGIRNVNADAAAEELLKAGEAAHNNKQRRHVLKLWKVLGPNSESLRRKFVRRVMIPYARSNKEALRYVITHIDLALPLPRGVRQPFIAALREQGKAAGIRKRVDERLLEAGLLEKTGRIRKRLVETPDE